MGTKILLLALILVIGCGKDVKFTNHLETNSMITEAAPLPITDSATITRSVSNPPGSMSFGGKSYKISPFSSYQSLNYINAMSDGASVSVKFRGEVKGSEIYIKVIE